MGSVRRSIVSAAVGLLGGALALPASAVDIDTGQLLYGTEGNRLRRYDVDTIDAGPLRQDVLIRNASEGETGNGGGEGRDVNGMVCVLPDGNLVMGEDTGQPTIRPGYGVFTPEGEQVGKLAFTGFRPQPEPFGCAVDTEGRLFTTEVGDPFAKDGQLMLWFPPFEGFPGAPGTYPNGEASTNYCKLAIDIGAASGIAVDPEGRVLVASPRDGRVFRFSGDWPTGPDAAGGCGRTDSTGAPLVDEGRIGREDFIQHATVGTPAGVARGPNGNWFVSSVLTSSISEFDPNGAFVRSIMSRPMPLVLPAPNGHPQTIVFDAQGNLYYADLNLVGSILDPGPGPNGSVRRIRFDAMGDPSPPEFVRRGLAFPDGVSVLPGDLEPTEWRTLGGSARRLHYNPGESTIRTTNAAELVKRWEFPAGAIITASPTVATVDVPGEGRVSTVFFQAWDEHVYAVRIADGTLLWSFETALQPGAFYPGAASAHVETIDGQDVVLIGAGETFYSLDAATGAELWHFTAGTGCRDEFGQPPGLCGRNGERNEIESTAIVVDDTVVFGMDVNDRETGKGGVFGLDVRTGLLRWFFDLESGATCRPDPGDAVIRFDGYHTEEELGLPAGFFATRSGCDFDRTTTGCGNVWSSFAADLERQRLYVASSNCDTDDDPGTPRPGPTMPPYDEAIFALDFDGNPIWRWRPREVDNEDLAFGATPNLFTIDFGGAPREVLGVGGKDGTYYVLDRDGVNEVSGVPWDDPDPSQLPYWRTNVVPGGNIGGIIASAAVDPDARRIYFSTAYGVGSVNLPPGGQPQRPTMHALDMDTGAVVWDNGTDGGTDNDASYAPTSAIPGVVFTGTVLLPALRIWDADTGDFLRRIVVSNEVLFNAIASATTAVDGTLLVGTGIGERSGLPGDDADQASRFPRALVAYCVPGTRGCGECRNGVDDDDDGLVDWPEDSGCTSEDDASERRPDHVCDNGLDDDGDGSVDADDPGCPFPYASIEDPQCDDGIDNNEDGLVDWFDPNCQPDWPYWERLPCGLGVELVLVLPLLGALARRRG